ncbi:MAG: ROK family protein [Ginsengibacter sp.]
MYRIGIDLGGTRIKVGLVLDGLVVASRILSTPSDKGLESQLEILQTEIFDLCSEIGDVDFKQIGIGFPGLVNTDENKVICTSSKFTDAPSLDLIKWAKEMFGATLKMDNDARLACLGEWFYGAGRGTSDMVMYTLGTGIGTSVVIEGKLMRGKHFQAGILGGHIVIDYKDELNKCSCGKYGCLEAVASMWMIQKLAMQHPLFYKSLLAKVEKINWQIILELSGYGDELSLFLRQHCLNTWAVGLVNLVHAYDPERVVVGGGIINNPEAVLPYFRKFMEDRAWYSGGMPEIVSADFPDTAGLLGAAALFE